VSEEKFLMDAADLETDLPVPSDWSPQEDLEEFNARDEDVKADE
jgi:hypothetical protein